MPPVPAPSIAGVNEKPKSWKVISGERKALKKQRKQAKLLKQLEEEQTKTTVEKTVEPPQVKKSNPSTVSIAVPGSILENAQSAELRAYVAGQVARAACIFRVSEVIVFDDIGMATARETKQMYEEDNGVTAEDGRTLAVGQTLRSSSLQLARILQYLECPQYLRKFFFPLHKDLKYSGLLNPLDAPHHLRQQNVFPFREGIVLEKAAKPGYSYANVGLLNNVLINKAITPGLRVTIKLDPTQENTKKQRGTAVSPDEPRRETGVYWGYNVRIVQSFSEIFTKSPYEGGYDLTIGTSDKGASVHETENKSLNYKHLLIVFGGIKGLEEAILNDDKLNVDEPALLFDHYLNVLPKQGSRTIRTEEALLIAMAALGEKINPEVPDIEELAIKNLLPCSEDTGIKKPMLDHQPNQKKQKKRLAASQESTQNESNEVEINVKRSKSENPFSDKPKKQKRNGDAADVDDNFEIIGANDVKMALTKQSKDKDDLSRFD